MNGCHGRIEVTVDHRERGNLEEFEVSADEQAHWLGVVQSSYLCLLICMWRHNRVNSVAQTRPSEL